MSANIQLPPYKLSSSQIL